MKVAKRFAALLVGVLVILWMAPVAHASTTLHVDYTEIGIYPRAEPSMSSAQVGSALPDRTAISVECEADGEPVFNGDRTISIWEKLSDGTWVPNAFVDTGSDGYTPGVPRCNQTQSETATAQPTTSATCYGDYCSGQDPVATGCSADAETLDFLVDDKGGGRLELRWSPTCKTNWARWQQYPTGVCMNCSPIGMYALQEGGYMQSVDFSNDRPEPTSWTPMIYSPKKKVAAGVHWPCGDRGLFSAAMDCLLSGKSETRFL